jgi:hypothetical protein
MQRAIVRGHDAEDDLEAFEIAPIGGENRPRDGRAVTALSRLRVAEKNSVIRIECRAQRDIEKAALSACVHTRYAPDRRADFTLRGDDTQPARLFGDEQIAAGQRLDGPRLFEALRQNNDIECDVRFDGTHAGLARKRRVLIGRIGLTRFDRRATLHRTLACTLSRPCGHATYDRKEARDQ